MTKYLGSKFQNSCYVIEGGIAGQYLPEDEMEKFLRTIVARIEQDSLIGKAYCKEVIDRSESVMKLLNAMEEKKELTKKDFLVLQKELYAHVPPNLAVKRSADYLSSKTLSILLSDMEKARIATEPVYPKFDKLIKKFATQICEKEKYPLGSLETLTHEEILTYFETRKLPTKKVIGERVKGIGLWYKEGACTILVGKDFIEFKQILDKQKMNDFVSGRTAYPGVVKGIAKIIFDPTKPNDFKEGDILVTGMTRPEFIPIMSKAAAFVTDAGGVLSHAAITARETKKPCVIGTITATKLIKDGDLIEVDATRGIVKIIKKV
jgi:phosphohistidine swiveling domain-containing protein